MGDEHPWRDKYGPSIFGKEVGFTQHCRSCGYNDVPPYETQCRSCRQQENQEDEEYKFPYRSRSREREEYEARVRELHDAIRHKDDTLDRQARQIEKHRTEVDSLKYLLDQARKDLSKAQNEIAANVSTLLRSQDLNAELRKQATEDLALLDSKTQAIKDRETAIRALTLAVVALEAKLGRQIPGEQELRRNQIQTTDVKYEKAEEKPQTLQPVKSQLDLEWNEEYKFRLLREANFITLFKWVIVAVTWFGSLVVMY